MAGKMDEKTRNILIAVVVVALVLLLGWYMMGGKEKFTQFTVDMASARHPDPTWMKYAGRQRAPSGQDSYDNFYENKMMWQQGVADRPTGLAGFEPGVPIPHPRIAIRSRYGLERGDRHDSFRNSELTWAAARTDLNRERPAAPATRYEIETRAAEAENAALDSVVNDGKASATVREDALQERMSGRY